jgi:PAS domain S-box-containing protein
MAGILDFWNAYKGFVDDAIQGNENSIIKDIKYWRARLFKNFILYALPVSILALAPAIYFGLKAGHVAIITFDVLVFVVFAFVSLNKSLTISFRKWFAACLFYLLSLVLIATLGSFGPGVLYLMSSSGIYTLIFSTRVGYLSVLFHVFTSIFFAGVIKFRLFETPLLDTYDVGSWIAFSSNIVFLSLISVVMISKIIHGLENTIIKESKLRSALEKESLVREKLNLKLQESKGHYKSIFNQNPSPMWVVDALSLDFLQVNDAAVKLYGFSNAEFLNMNVCDLRLPDDEDCKSLNFHDSYYSGKRYHYYTRHVKKDREIFDVEIRCNSIRIQGKHAILAIGRDITDVKSYIKAIEAQNKKLHEIALVQSHVVRAPLANIMGLVNLIKMNGNEKPDFEIIKQLEIATAEFDDIVRDITKCTEQADVVMRKG